MRRAVEVYGDARYKRLAGLSVGHLYNLRKRTGYLARRQHWTKTKGTSVSIGERRAPSPDGRPGSIRMDKTSIRVTWMGSKAFTLSTPWIAKPNGNRLPPAKRSARRTCCRSSGSSWTASLSDPGLSSRQRLGVHQPPGGQDAGQTAGGVHQVTPPPFQRQRLGGDQGAVVRKHFGYEHLPQQRWPTRSTPSAGTSSTPI